MLKIKDNIDLKELEKYELKLKYECNEDNGAVYVTEIYKTDGDCCYDIKFKAEPECFELFYINLDGVGILYNLIKDGLVEKVNKENK